MTNPVSLRDRVAALSDKSYGLARRYLDAEIARLSNSSGRHEAGLLEEARLVRAEVLQKMGWLETCKRELDSIDSSKLSVTSRQGLFLVRAKVATQRGDFVDGRIALATLGDMLGTDNHSEIGKTFLWRQAFILGVTQGSATSEALAEEHLESVSGDGFQEANNLLYARVLPKIAAGEDIGRHYDTSMAHVQEAGHLYLNSAIAASGRIHHRKKSLAQSLMAESAVHCLAGDHLRGFRTAFVAGALLRDAQLGPDCEGVGEILGVLRTVLPALAQVLVWAMCSEDEEIEARLPSLAAEANAKLAFTKARDICVELFGDRQLTDVYLLLKGSN